MKPISAAISLLLFGTTSALAADLPTSKTALAATSEPIWTGFYAGLNSGYGFGVSSNAQNYGWANPAYFGCLLYTSPSPRDGLLSRMPSSA